MQMKPREFWHEFSFADYQRRAFYFFRNKDDEFKDNWERLRHIIHVTAAVHGTKGTAQELMPFMWDRQKPMKKHKPITASEGAAIIARYQKMGLFDKHKLN